MSHQALIFGMLGPSKLRAPLRLLLEILYAAEGFGVWAYWMGEEHVEW